jgi:hypothetical protein
MKKAESKTYTKYRTFHLPKEMVDLLFITSHITPLESYPNSIEIGLTVINDIISKSHIFNKDEDFTSHVIPMYSKYLQLKYGNDYSSYINWMVNNSVIWNDLPYEGYSSHYYLHSITDYNNLISNKLKLTNKKLEDIIIGYCLQSNTQITPITSVIKGVNDVQKNRIYTNWYKIKIPINSKNKRYLIKDYEKDSIFINNAPKHIKLMGAHYRKHIDIDDVGATEHANNRLANELSLATNIDDENKAYKRYSSRMASITAIKKGRLNKTLRFNRNNTNRRLDTNLTNMASDLRPFIIGYQSMAYLDLSNSQPVLFNNILQTYRKNASSKVLAELDRYLEVTTSGKWYEELIRVYDVKYGPDENLTFEEARNVCKKVWMLLAYSNNNEQRNLKKVFAVAYPFISSVIKSIKKSNYNQFAISLQLVESKVFIDKICKQLVNEGIIPYTMHDGLLVPKESLDRTKEVMLENLKEFIGVYPIIKVESN